MISKRSIAIAAFMACLLAAIPASAQKQGDSGQEQADARPKSGASYCPMYLIGQYYYNGSYMYYYACEVCDSGGSDNCTEQNVFLSNPADCSGGGCSGCPGGGTCSGTRKKGGPAPKVTADDPNGLDVSSDNNTDYADEDNKDPGHPHAPHTPTADDFVLPSPRFQKTMFYVNFSDGSNPHPFQCFFVKHSETGRYVCLGREMKNDVTNDGHSHVPTSGSHTKTGNDNHIRVKLANDPVTGKALDSSVTLYCYLTVHEPSPW